MKSLKSSKPTICTVAQKCEYDEILAIVTDILMSASKAKAWMTTPNRNFGNFSPLSLILRDKSDKVREFITESRMYENIRKS